MKLPDRGYCAVFRTVKKQTRIVPITILAMSILSCARVTVRKVPTPTQYSKWTDKEQKQADEMHGLRFYLPRPFVNVFESFPVRTDVAIADGYVSADGKYVIITRVRGTGPLVNAFAPADGKIMLPSNQILAPKAADPGGQNRGNQQGRVETPNDAVHQDTNGKAADSGSVQVPKAAAPPNPPEVSVPTPPNTGVNEQGASNNNAAFAYQPLRGNLDIVYLPDFEEQYVVDSKAGLGNAKFQLNLGQGWSLQGFNSLTDNSEINRRIFALVDHASTIAKSAADAASGNLLSLLNRAGQANTGGNAQAGVESAARTLATLPATPVSLKVVVVHYAAKGLYPIMKPIEISKAQRGTVAFNLAMQSPAAPNATIPIYPYQYISFNTFAYLALELITPEAEPFRTLYNATGTEGPGGGRTDEQLLHMLDALHKLSAPPAPPESPVVTNAPPAAVDFVTEFMKEKPRLPATGDRFYTLRKPKLAGSVLTAELEVSTAGKPALDEDAAREDFLKQAQDKAKELKTTEITDLKFTNLPDLGDLKTILAAIIKVRVPKGAADTAKYVGVKTAFLDTVDADKNTVLTVDLTPMNQAGAIDAAGIAALEAQIGEILTAQKLTLKTPVKIIEVAPPPPAAVDFVAEFLKGNPRVPATGDRFYTLRKPKLAGSVLTAELELSAAGKPVTDEDAARKDFLKQAQDKAKELKATAITELKFANLPDLGDLKRILAAIMKIRVPRGAADTAKYTTVKTAFLDTVDPDKSTVVTVDLTQMNQAGAIDAAGIADLEAQIGEMFTALKLKLKTPVKIIK